MKFSLLLCVSIAGAFVFPSSLFAQSDQWESSLISHHAVATVNVNVPRMLQTYKDSEVFEKLKTGFAERDLDLLKIDQFQDVFVSDPQLEKGADDSHHTQLTFIEATDFNAELVGKYSGYKLHPEKIESWSAYVGDPEKTGAWGGLSVNDRTLIYGVTRMLKSVVASQEKELAAGARFSQTKKTRR